MTYNVFGGTLNLAQSNPVTKQYKFVLCRMLTIRLGEGNVGLPRIYV